MERHQSPNRGAADSLVAHPAARPDGAPPAIGLGRDPDAGPTVSQREGLRFRPMVDAILCGAALPRVWAIKTVLIPKPTGGTRPIQILAAAMRLWAKARLPVLLRWQDDHGLPAQIGGSLEP
eukprot:3440120-Amphidinium_carterae.1